MGNTPGVQRNSLNGLSSLSVPAFGSSLEVALALRGDSFVPHVVRDITTTLRKHGLQEEGMFRIPADQALEDDIVRRANSGGYDFTTILDDTLLAALLKRYFRMLPEPFFTESVYHALSVALDNSVEMLQIELQKLSTGHQRVLAYLCLFLHEMSTHSAKNFMHVKNIAMCWAPCLVHISSQEALTKMGKSSALINALVSNAPTFFKDIQTEPKKLARPATVSGSVTPTSATSTTFANALHRAGYRGSVPAALMPLPSPDILNGDDALRRMPSSSSSVSSNSGRPASRSSRPITPNFSPSVIPLPVYATGMDTALQTKTDTGRPLSTTIRPASVSGADAKQMAQKAMASLLPTPPVKKPRPQTTYFSGSSSPLVVTNVPVTKSVDLPSSIVSGAKENVVVSPCGDGKDVPLTRPATSGSIPTISATARASLSASSSSRRFSIQALPPPGEISESSASGRRSRNSVSMAEIGPLQIPSKRASSPVPLAVSSELARASVARVLPLPTGVSAEQLRTMQQPSEGRRLRRPSVSSSQSSQRTDVSVASGRTTTPAPSIPVHPVVPVESKVVVESSKTVSAPVSATTPMQRLEESVKVPRLEAEIVRLTTAQQSLQTSNDQLRTANEQMFATIGRLQQQLHDVTQQYQQSEIDRKNLQVTVSTLQNQLAATSDKLELASFKLSVSATLQSSPDISPLSRSVASPPTGDVLRNSFDDPDPSPPKSVHIAPGSSGASVQRMLPFSTPTEVGFTDSLSQISQLRAADLRASKLSNYSVS